MKTIELFDTTLRDGEQSPGAAMTPRDRVRIARMLAEARVDTIEAGFPAASPLVAQSVNDIARAVRTARIAALARCVERDIDCARDALRGAARPRIHVFIATSQTHLRYKLKIDGERALELAVASIRYARRFCDDVEFSAEDATRSDRDFLARIFAAAAGAGATTVNIPDTVGYTTPAEMHQLVSYVRERLDDRVAISTHTHNDLGMATANALAAIAAGAIQVECTVNGIGERAGNCALEEVAVALRTRRDVFDAQTRFDTTRLAKLSRAVARATHMPVQKNKAIVGKNAFAHESGIHQDGFLKERTTYEIIDAASVGVASSLPLGRNSGRHAVFDRAAHLGLAIDAEQSQRFYDAFVEFAQTRRVVRNADLARIAQTVSG